MNFCIFFLGGGGGKILVGTFLGFKTGNIHSGPLDFFGSIF